MAHNGCCMRLADRHYHVARIINQREDIGDVLLTTKR